MSKNSTIKDKVRKSREWKELRELKLKEQKLDPITGKKIAKGANCHHLDLHLENYGVFDEERL